MNFIRLIALCVPLFCGLSPLNAQLQPSEELEALSKLPSKELYELGENAYHSEDYEKAATIFMVICSRYNDNDNEEEQRIYAKSFNRSGNLYYNASAYASAMDHYLKAQKIVEIHKFDDLKGSIYGNIGNIYAANNDFESAISAYKQALPYAYRFNNQNLLSMALNNLVGAFAFNGDVDSALHYERLFEGVNSSDQRYRYDVCLNRSMIFNGMSQYDSAKIYARQAFLMAQEDSLSQLCVAAIHSCMAHIFEEEGLLDSAITYLMINEKIAKEMPSDELLVSTVQDLAHIYELRNEPEKAADYKAEYLEISHSLLSQKEFNELKNKQVFHELERNASTINTLNAVRVLQRHGLLALSAAVTIFILLVFILFYQKRKLKAAYEELYERNLRQLSEQTFYKRKIQTLEKSLEKADIKISALATLATTDLADDDDDQRDDGAAMEAPNDGKAGISGVSEVSDATEAATAGAATAGTAGDAETPKGQAVTTMKTGTEPKESEEHAGGNRKIVVHQAQRDKIANDIMRVMETTDDYCAMDYSIDKLAASIDSNARYVSEVINDVFGRNFRDLLNEYRIKVAMVRLSDIEHYGHLTIKAISESVGYKSQATFITAFTKFTGLKPGLYQKLSFERYKKSGNNQG